MNKFLLVTAAAAAMVAAASPAAAQTNTRHYAGTATVTIPLPGPDLVVNLNAGVNNPGPVSGFLLDQLVENSTVIGTRYTARADAPSDTTTARDRIDVVFSLSGRVNRDCSFYAGNDSSARNIDFGVIGIRTGDNENVNQAFEMVGPAEAAIETLTAGCNFNNEVTIAKNDIRGLVNTNPGGYDTDEFQANIPYSVTAKWTGVGIADRTAGSSQSLTLAENANSATKSQGAWRSSMSIDILAPVQPKGLVAGDYTGTTTLTLRAL